MKNEKGFTLIELVVVIFILGILSAAVAPQFMSMQTDARNSKIRGMKGAMITAIDIAYIKFVVNGLENTLTVWRKDVPIDGCDKCIFNYGYPMPGITLAAIVDGIGEGLDDDFAVAELRVMDGGYSAKISPVWNVENTAKRMLKDDSCYVLYTQFLTPNKPPTFDVIDCK
jgi:MSHA pilin protein MshA